MPQWLDGHQELFYWLTGASVVLLLASLIVLPIVLVRLPAEYFQERFDRRRSKHLGLRIARNIVGWIIIVIGLAMLVLPGQGLLMVLVGVMLADFPGKVRLERWIISRKKVLGAANWLRQQFGKPPLKAEGRLSAQ